MLKIKVQFGNDIRRWHCPQSQRFQSLLSFVKQTFNFLDERQFYVQYEDDEGDRLTLTSEIDIKDAFSCAEQESRKSLKIFVMKGSIEDAHNNDASASIVSVSSPIQSSIHEKQQQSQVLLQSESQSQLQSQEKQAKPKNKEEVQKNEKPIIIENEKKSDEKTQEQCKSENSCDQWREIVLDFLQNKEIQTLLPQLVRRLITSLRQNQQSSSQKNLLTIINEILGEDQFKPIVNHKAYSQKIVFMLPCLVEKFQHYQHVLLAFNEDAISSWIPHLINILISSLTKFQNIDLEIDVDPLFAQASPLFCPFSFLNNNNNCDMNCNNDNDNDNDNCCFNDENQEAIHSNVACNNCQHAPIKGTRYKCTVCADYDLCSNCEALGKHDVTHPMLKITHPANSDNHLFDGLHEFVKWSKRQRRADHHHQHQHHHSHGMRRRHFWPSHCPRRHHAFREHFDNEHNNMNDQQSPCCSNNDCNEGKKIGVQVVSDITIPDRSYCPLNMAMTKTWRVRNDGNVEWGNDVKLAFFKGNECLALEKLRSMPNIKPGEEINVSISIKTPSKSGRYCTYYRFKKNEAFFGPKLWVDLFAVEHNDKSIKKDDVKCLCGEVLVATPPRQAYNNLNVYCDVCNSECSSDETVYHCPSNKNGNHPDGYDVCTKCVNAKLFSFSDRINADNSNQKSIFVDIQLDIPKVQENENENKNSDKINKDENKDNDANKNDSVKNEDQKENKNEQNNVVPVISSVIGNETVNNNQIKNEDPNKIEPKPANVPSASNNNNNNNNEEDKFEYKESLKSLLEMGFFDVETIKLLLIKHKGGVERVVQELLQ